MGGCRGFIFVAAIVAVASLEVEEIVRLNGDGSATHPIEMRDLMRTKTEYLERIREKKPELYAAVQGDDLEVFQEQMRANNRDKAVGEDGAPLDPAGYRSMILKAGVAHGLTPEQWLERLKGEDAEMHAAVTTENEEEGMEIISKLMRDRHLNKQLTEGIGEDGGPIDPPAYRALILGQSESFMADLKGSDAEFHAAVTTEGDAGLEKMTVLMRQRKWKQLLAAQLTEDGSAGDPSAFRKLVRSGGSVYGIERGEWLTKLRGDDIEMHAAVTTVGADKLVQMQKLLRARHQKARMQAAAAAAPTPEATPYDAMGSSVRMKDKDGKETDQYMVLPKETEAEREGDTLPQHMECAACSGFSFQAAIAITDALAFNLKTEAKRRQPSALAAHQAVEKMCLNLSSWVEYGVEAGTRGINLLSGPGIPVHAEAIRGDANARAHSMHSVKLGAQLAQACEQIVVGADDEDAVLNAVVQANEAGGDAAASISELLCTEICDRPRVDNYGRMLDVAAARRAAKAEQQQRALEKEAEEAEEEAEEGSEEQLQQEAELEKKFSDAKEEL